MGKEFLIRSPFAILMPISHCDYYCFVISFKIPISTFFFQDSFDYSRTLCHINFRISLSILQLKKSRWDFDCWKYTSIWGVFPSYKYCLQIHKCGISFYYIQLCAGYNQISVFQTLYNNFKKTFSCYLTYTILNFLQASYIA